jgi:hypothetical protein
MYQKIIIEATGASEADAEEIEDIMRHDIFHSTLDWQTRKQLQDAARLGMKILSELRGGEAVSA